MESDSVPADICIETLVSGHVASFSEFFSLIVRNRLIPSHSVEQLHAFKDLLRASENGKRSGSARNVYLALTQLATFFGEVNQYDMRYTNTN